MPPERLGAWLRDFDVLLKEHGLDGVPYGHFGDGCVHVRIDFPFEPDGGVRRSSATSSTACALKLREHGGSLSGEHGDGRARSELLPMMYDEESLRLFAAVKAICDPREPAQPRQHRRPRAARRRPAAGPAAAAAPAGRRGAPLHRRRQVRGAADQRRDVPVLPRDPRREGLHPRPVAGAPGGARRRAGAGASPTRPCTRRSTSAWPARAARRTARPAWTWRPTRPRRCTRRTPAQGKRRPRSHLLLGRLPKWARLAAPMAPLANRMMRLGPVARLAKATAGIDQRRSIPAFAPKTLRRTRVRCPERRTCRTCGSGRTRSPTTSSPTTRSPRSVPGVGRRDRAGDPRRRLLRADLGDHRAARRGARDHGRARCGRCGRTSSPACRSSGWSRPAWRRCAATCPSCSGSTSTC